MTYEERFPFAINRRAPVQIFLLEAKCPLVRDTVRRDIREDWFDVSAEADRSAGAGLSYATVLCGGEPYSRWH